MNDPVWEHVSGGRHVLLLGPPPPPPPQWLVVTVRCDGPRTTAGPLELARGRLLDAVGLGEVDEPAPSAGSRPFLGVQPIPIEARFVDACNRVVGASVRPSALVLDAVDKADEDTLESLVEILARPLWLSLPLVLVVRDAFPTALEEAVRVSGGVVLREAAPAVPDAGVAVPAPRGWDPSAASAEARRILRAAAAIGSVFEVELVAVLLGRPLVRVLETLQEAADDGAPLSDDGAGRMALPEVVVTALRASTLPSLSSAWNERLAEYLAGRKRAAPAPDRFAGTPASEPDETAVAEPERAEHATATKRDGAAEPAAGGEAPRGAPERVGDPLRAAAHLREAGRIEEAVDAYLDAAESLAEGGDVRRARRVVAEAGPLLEAVASARRGQVLRARLAMTLGRLHWLGAGDTSDLHEALEALERAHEALPDDAPAPLRARLASLNAGVAYDLGDQASLQRALDQLSAVSRALLAAGEALSAAHLLNDMAALELRLGDPVQAVHLLMRSRRIFERSADSADPSVQAELAVTEHLMARLPLHAPLRPGHETEALELAREHAHSAEARLARLGAGRALARVHETLARLDLLAGDLDGAAGRLREVIETQRRLGDVVGLARSAAAYSELLARAGRADEAARALTESIALNREVGSRIGLGYNRRAFEALSQAGGTPAPELQVVARELEAAEARLGRAVLPPTVEG
ncbi:MAG: hypothetical protein H6982_14760 [Chromatiales bacterium]|nr:hypothetical protein [Chromatiales bacterium]